ncbi:hypothetical protein POM88_054920 [Heracleum sosnowskyi]|uniref:Uncharacterized protein n=1 Tax=Heracleum sosnowskyi TaxID=360622 RepID=A0AAD8GM85_9APIA|nr:hypothetical protein POM88_054920 [Heracleum sosnowskyi]
MISGTTSGGKSKHRPEIYIEKLKAIEIKVQVIEIKAIEIKVQVTEDVSECSIMCVGTGDIYTKVLKALEFKVQKKESMMKVTACLIEVSEPLVQVSACSL